MIRYIRGLRRECPPLPCDSGSHDRVTPPSLKSPARSEENNVHFFVSVTRKRGPVSRPVIASGPDGSRRLRVRPGERKDWGCVLLR